MLPGSTKIRCIGSEADVELECELTFKECGFVIVDAVDKVDVDAVAVVEEEKHEDLGDVEQDGLRWW